MEKRSVAISILIISILVISLGLIVTVQEFTKSDNERNVVETGHVLLDSQQDTYGSLSSLSSLDNEEDDNDNFESLSLGSSGGGGGSSSSKKKPKKADNSDTTNEEINSSYRISGSPYLRLPEDIANLLPMVPPEPREVGEIEDPTAIEIYDIATKKVTKLSSKNLIQETQKTDLNLSTTPSYSGLLSDEILQKETASIESIIGSDGRSRITSTSSFPWRTITQLIVTFPNGFTYGCSGAIIGRSDNNAFHVLTAGHCVHSISKGGWATSIRVVPGLDDDYMPYNYAWATNLKSYSGWVNYQTHQYDLAVITLDRRVGNFVGWMGRQTDSYLSSIYRGWLNTAGYPCDKGHTTMWFDADYGRTANLYNHWYYMDTMGCQSGSPVWRMDGENRYILTVHAYGDDGTSSNHGTRLNLDKYNRITTWINSDSLPNDKADLIDDGQAYAGFSPTTVVRGQTNFHVWSDVSNIGTASSGGFYVSYYASIDNYISPSDYLIGTDYVYSIYPFNYRDSYWYTFPSNIPSGTYYVGWIIDSRNNVAEFDETNNKAYKSSYRLVVKRAPGDYCSLDLQCSSSYCEGSQSYSARCCSSAPPSDGYYCSTGEVRQYRDYYCSSSGSYNYQVISSYDCDNSDGWYDLSWSCDGTCRRKKNQEYRNYYCSGGSCTYSVTNTQTVYENCAANKACSGGVCSSSYYCDSNYRCSSGSGDNKYNAGGQYRCQGKCDGNNQCDYAVNCQNCGTDSCSDSGDSWTTQNYIIDYETCSNGICLTDDIRYDYCSEDIVYDRQCGTYDETTVTSYNCNNYDTTDCWCTTGADLIEGCNDWTCSNGACQDSGSDLTKNSWSCNDGNECNQQGCQGTNYICYRTNVGSWNWATYAESTEDDCFDGYDNDCDSKTDLEDSDCVECSSNEQCDDSNPYTEDICNNEGTIESYCTHLTIACLIDINCGTNVWMGDPYCKYDDVYQRYKTYTCNYAGTSDSYCSNSTAPKLKEDCPNECIDGRCNIKVCKTVCNIGRCYEYCVWR